MPQVHPGVGTVGLRRLRRKGSLPTIILIFLLFLFATPQHTYAVVPEHSHDLQQSHLPELLHGLPGHQPLVLPTLAMGDQRLRGMQNGVFNHKEPEERTRDELEAWENRGRPRTGNTGQHSS